MTSDEYFWPTTRVGYPARQQTSSSVRINRRRRVEGEFLTAIKCCLKNPWVEGVFGNPVKAGHFSDEWIA